MVGLSHADTIGQCSIFGLCILGVGGGGHRRVEYVQDLVALGDAWRCHLSGECCKDNQG